MNPELCVLWVASDVLMCSASIWHMCTMSMDRYFTLKYPMRYGRNKTRRMVAGKILFVWVVSVAISSPVCIHGFMDTSSVFRNGECVPKVKNFVIFGSVFAFYIPLLIMIVTYFLTIRILWKNQQRMKHIERSDLKPKLAQITAQCTGLAIPKLLTSLRKSHKSISSSHLSRLRTRKRPPGTCSSSILSIQSTGIENNTSDLDFSDDSGAGGGRNNLGMVYLAPPPTQTCTPGSSSSIASVPPPINSDTDESENETNYFSLFQTRNSSRSLCTPVSLSTSEKSLHRRLQKKQLYQQQQQELYLLRQEYHQQRQLHHDHQDDASLSSSPQEDMPKDELPENQVCLFSATASPISHPLPLLHLEAHHHQMCPLSDNILVTSSQPTTSSVSKLYRKSSKFNSTEKGRKSSKKKRYSKRCKKRRNSFVQDGTPTQHLKVPCPIYFKRQRATKPNIGHTVLSTAVSDSQVSQAGRENKLGNARDQGVTSFHLSYSNLSKDYKSLEWDRRYFQIQEEMDLCLKGEFDLWDRRHSKQNPDVLSHKERVSGDGRHSTRQRTACLKSDISLPVLDNLNIDNNSFNTYSHSAPNSPLNRRNVDSLNFTSEDDMENEEDKEETSDRTNDEEGNDSTESSNSDVVTIRLYPPTPKVKSVSSVDGGSSSSSSSSHHTLTISCSSDNHSASTLQTITCLNVPSNNITTRTSTDNLTRTQYSSLSHNQTKDESNHKLNNSLVNGSSCHNLSPASSSPLPELVISSEGEMTLEETDDTVDDSPKHNRIKLRRPHQLESHHRFRRKPSPNDPSRSDNHVKPRRSVFRNTFRVHKRKHAVKHILSKKTATNERKASKVLGIIFLVFVTLWTPFFAVNVINASCDTCMDNFNREMMSLFLWMGYIASLANPIIYTMFNTAFRRTFIRILTCQIRCTRRAKTSDLHYMSCTTMLASERRNTMTVVLRDESR